MAHRITRCAPSIAVFLLLGHCSGEDVLRLHRLDAGSLDDASLDAGDAADSEAPLQVVLDPSFGIGGAVDGSLATWTPVAVAVDRQGRVLVAGPENTGVAPSTETLRRLTVDGVIDTTFGQEGRVAIPLDPALWAQTARILPDGRIGLIGAMSDPQNETAFAVLLKDDGSFDPTWPFQQPLVTQSFGMFSTGLWLDDGSSFVFAAQAVIHYDATGHLARTYGANGAIAAATAGYVDTEGRLWATSSNTVFRYLSSGVPDMNFGQGGAVAPAIGGGDASPLSLEVLVGSQDGAVAIGSYPKLNSYDVEALRVTNAGTLDVAYGGGASLAPTVSAPMWANGLADGRIVVLTADGDLLELSQGGALENSWNLDVYGTVLSAAVDPSGRLVVVGVSTSDPISSTWFVRRYLPL